MNRKVWKAVYRDGWTDEEIVVEVAAGSFRSAAAKVCKLGKAAWVLESLALVKGGD